MNLPTLLGAWLKEVMAMLKAIHAQEDRQAAREKAAQVTEKLAALRLGQAATTVREGVEETLTQLATLRVGQRNEYFNRLLVGILDSSTSSG
jgi:hypothetical protein